ncbi:Nn.00g032980.m01.CDS01 [Neocucurbitaria sp. VM-36]
MASARPAPRATMTPALPTSPAIMASAIRVTRHGENTHDDDDDEYGTPFDLDDLDGMVFEGRTRTADEVSSLSSGRTTRSSTKVGTFTFTVQRTATAVAAPSSSIATSGFPIIPAADTPAPGIPVPTGLAAVQSNSSSFEERLATLPMTLPYVHDNEYVMINLHGIFLQASIPLRYILVGPLIKFLHGPELASGSETYRKLLKEISSFATASNQV